MLANILEQKPYTDRSLQKLKGMIFLGISSPNWLAKLETKKDSTYLTACKYGKFCLSESSAWQISPKSQLAILL